MLQAKFRPGWMKRRRARRAPREREDPAVVFKTFVQVLARLRANAREAAPSPMAIARENG